MILRPCERQLELGQLCEVSVHVLVLADLLEGEVGLAQDDALPHDAAVLEADLQSRLGVIGSLGKAEMRGNEVGINGY